MKAFDGGFLDRAIHSFNLAVYPRMPHLREAVFNPVLATNVVEDVREGVRIQGAVGELNAGVGQHGVDPVGRRLQQITQKLRRFHLARPLLQSHKGELRRAVNGNKEIQLALGRSDFGQIKVKISDGIPFEALLGRLVAADLRQVRDAVALWAPMQGRAAQMRDGRLQRVQAIVQRQQRVAAKRRQTPPRLRC